MSQLIKKQSKIPQIGIVPKNPKLGISFWDFNLASFIGMLCKSLLILLKNTFSPSPHFPHLGVLGRVLIFPQNPHTPFRGWGLGDRGWGNA